MGKSSLDDLVEEPAEIDGGAENNVLTSSFEEFCICKLRHEEIVLVCD
jgi:hypothetical protein